MAKKQTKPKNNPEKPVIQNKEPIESAPENAELKNNIETTKKLQGNHKVVPPQDMGTQLKAQIISQIVLLLGLVAGVILGELKIIQAILLWILGGGTIAFTIQLIFSIQERQLPGIETFWGGLDGGIGGWELSKGATYFILVFVFGTLFFLSSGDFLVKMEEKEKERDLNVLEIKRLESVQDSLQALIGKIKTESGKSKEQETATDTTSNKTE